MNKPKVVVIGIDGANEKIAELVGLKRFNVHTTLLSTIPPYTPPAWTSIFTGVNPAKHGIIGWQKINTNTLKTKLVTSHDVKYPRLSELLDTAGIKSIIINIPLTYPFSGVANKDNTIIISDWAASKQAIYPKKLFQTYREYLIDPPHDWIRYIKNKNDYSSLVKEFTQTRVNLYYELLEKEDWNLFFVIFSETDWFSHIYPQILEGKGKHLVAPVFKLIYKFIQYVQENADVTLVISDHGFEIKNRIFYVNSALARGGFINYNRFKLELIRLIDRICPRTLLKLVVKVTGTPSNVLWPILNLEKTKAFMSPESTTWGIYVKDMLINNKVKIFLKNFIEVQKIIDSNQLYSGPYINHLPSLFIIPNKGVEFSCRLSDTLTETTYMSDHEMQGIFYVSGKGIRNENIRPIRTFTVYDIAPTILHIFGLPIPNDMDGRVLMEIFEPDSEFVRRRPRYVDPSYYEKESENEKLKKAIKSLKLKGKI